MSIGPRTSVGERPHRILLQNPGPSVPNGDGGYTQTWSDLAPASVSASIVPATGVALERSGTGTVLSGATHIVAMQHHPQVTTLTRILFNGRTFSVTGVANPNESSAELILVCTEVVQ